MISYVSVHTLVVIRVHDAILRKLYKYNILPWFIGRVLFLFLTTSM